jgi:hypothetical protein
MGVQGLWSLLEPVGRRVNIEAIQNKRLAVGERAPCAQCTDDGMLPSKMHAWWGKPFSRANACMVEPPAGPGGPWRQWRTS